jgi:uncharacterized protein
MINFEWNTVKAAQNIKKHGVSFEEARSVFYDEFAVEYFDESHSSNEDRFILLGVSSQAKLLVVCYCERGQVSARKATKREQNFYPGK